MLVKNWMKYIYLDLLMAVHGYNSINISCETSDTVLDNRYYSLPFLMSNACNHNYSTNHGNY